MTLINEGPRVLPILLGASVKGSCIFLLVLALTAVLKNTRPSTRHLLWLLAIASYPLGAGIAHFLPPIDLPLFQSGNPAGMSGLAFLRDTWDGFRPALVPISSRPPCHRKRKPPHHGLEVLGRDGVALRYLACHASDDHGEIVSQRTRAPRRQAGKAAVRGGLYPR
jgi:hypothetical protein